MANGDFDFTAGQILTAAQVDDYLMLQAKQEYATSAARDSALTSRKREGTLTHQADANSLTIYSGSAWSTIGPVHGALTTFVPTWTNLTVGNGVLNIGSYQRIGRMIHNYKVRFTFGTTTAVTGAITPNVPFAAEGNVTEFECNANIMMYDSSAATRFAGRTSSVSSTTFKLQTNAFVDTSSTQPFTWATGDIIFFSMTYETSADA